MMTIYLIRHGETDLNKPGIFFGSTDEGLNALGIEQSKALSEAMKDIKLDNIVSSPMKRCIQTASYIASYKNLQIDIVGELIEMDFGLWEGLHYDEASRLYPAEWKKGMDDWMDMSPVQGEKFRNFYSRVCDALINIMEQYSGKRIALITHGGCMRVMVSFLLGLKQQGFWNFYFEHGKYSLLEIEEGHCTIKKINCI